MSKFSIVKFNTESNIALMDAWYDIYGIDAIVYRLKDPNNTDYVRKAYGHSIATYSVEYNPDKVDIIRIKLGLFTDSLGVENNPGSVQLSVIVSKDHKLIPGDQVEFQWSPRPEDIPLIKYIYWVQEQPETFYETFQRVNLVSVMTTTPKVDNIIEDESDEVIDLTTEELMGNKGWGIIPD